MSKEFKTVREVIELLAKCPPDAELLVDTEGGFSSVYGAHKCSESEIILDVTGLDPEYNKGVPVI